MSKIDSFYLFIFIQRSLSPFISMKNVNSILPELTAGVLLIFYGAEVLCKLNLISHGTFSSRMNTCELIMIHQSTFNISVSPATVIHPHALKKLHVCCRKYTFLFQTCVCVCVWGCRCPTVLN